MSGDHGNSGALFGALVVLGLISDAQDGEQAEPAGGAFVDNLTPTSDEAIANVPTVAAAAGVQRLAGFLSELLWMVGSRS
ncbi:MAG: hypothetical protein R2849_11180 [Thermomicrobiales bacterium]